MENNETIFRLGELFCGPGGIAYGALTAKIADERYKIVHQWASDYDKDTCETYIENICHGEQGTVYCEDVIDLDMTKLAAIDGLAFGFPCNDFSVVGEQKGVDGKFGPLYKHGVNALKHFKPKWFLAENVGGLQNANEGNAFDAILKELNVAGYNTVSHLYKFEEYGVPQARHRIIIVGIRKDLNVEFRVPSPAQYADRDNTCKTAIEVPPIPENAPNNELTRQSPNVVRRLQHILPGENAFTADLPDELKLKVAGARMSQIYKRLEPNKPAYTVTGSGGGGTHIYHWEEPRALTNRERARLQTFPDTFEFKGSKESVRKQIGMAVPCDGARIICEAILNSFAGIEYEYVEPNIIEEPRLVYSSLVQKVLFQPAREGANHLKIISGSAAHTMASWHIKELIEEMLKEEKRNKKKLLPVQITLIIGMCGHEGLKNDEYKGFKELTELIKELSLQDIISFSYCCIREGQFAGDNLYIWEKDGELFSVFSGPVDYTQSSFGSNEVEAMDEYDPQEAMKHFEEILEHIAHCTHEKVDKDVHPTGLSQTFDKEDANDPVINGADVDNVTLSFLITSGKRKGEIGEASSLNWGQRKGREPNQAYIPVNSKVAKSDFFPLKEKHFSVLTDDGEHLILRVEQAGNKAITTPHDNSHLGRYFRNRIGVAEGKPVKVSDLQKYGRSDVTFHKYNEELFYMDFSVNKKKDNK